MHKLTIVTDSDPLKVVVCEASFHLGGRVRTVWESELRGGSPPSHERWLRVVQRNDVLAASPSLGKTKHTTRC